MEPRSIPSLNDPPLDGVADQALFSPWIGLASCSRSCSNPSGMPVRSRNRSVAIRPMTVIPARYHVTDVVLCVACTSAWAMVGANAPPRMAPIAYEMDTPENRIDAAKLSALLRVGLDGLPPRQREVVLLRDVEGLSSAEVCEVLVISEANQRVLLHRGRSKLRQALESELGGGAR